LTGTLMLRGFDSRHEYSLTDEIYSALLAGRLEEFLRIPRLCR
jgi:hypothetical protein